MKHRISKLLLLFNKDFFSPSIPQHKSLNLPSEKSSVSPLKQLT